jgi:uncharacterized membrane protein (UPF0127 family)
LRTRPTYKSKKAKDAHRLGWREVLVASLLILASAAYLFTSNRTHQTVSFGENTFRVEVVDTLPLRQQGLSGRDSLQSNAAMLFIFDENAEHGIWMKDMNFSIDIIWLDENRRIVNIEKNVAPSTFPEVFRPSVDARYVLEIANGQAEKNNLRLGDQAQFNL